MGELVHAAEQVSLWLASRLLAGSIQGGIVVGLVWLACWRIRSIPASARAALWWLAALKLVLALTSLPSIPVPVLPADVPADSAIAADAGIGSALLPAVALQRAPSESPAPELPPPRRRWPWLPAVVALWTLGVALHASRLFAGWRRVRGVLARSAPIGHDDAALAARLATAVGLKTLPDVRVSEEIDSPQVVRIVRPVILLPVTVAGAFTSDERAMAICHELVHVRRHDLLFGWIPACAERLFFFHPLARLAAREYVLAREAACDAAVLQALGVAPREYGQVLLRLGVSGAEPTLSATAASKSRSSLKRRLDMLQDIARETSRRSMWLVAALMAVAVVPVHLVARHASPPPSEAANVSTKATNAAMSPVSSEERLEAVVSVAPDVVVAEAAQAQEPSRPGEQSESEALRSRYRLELDKYMAAFLASQAGAERAPVQATDEFLKEQLAEAHARLQIAEETAAQQRIEEKVQREKVIEELTAKLRELERAMVQQQKRDGARADAERAQREIERSLQRKAGSSAAGEAAPQQRTEADRAAALSEQLAQLVLMQKVTAERLQDLVKQQEVLRDAQMNLMTALDRIRLAIERAEQERKATAQPKK